MIVSSQVSLSRAVFSLGRPLAAVLLWSAGIALLHGAFPGSHLWVSPAPLTVAGVALSIFLAFRNNAVYDRYWEARTLWGGLINASRSFVRQMVTVFREEAAAGGEREEFIRAMSWRVIAFAQGLRHHLRDEDAMLSVAPYVPAGEQGRLRRVRNVPAGILMLLGEQLAAARRRGWADPILLASLDRTLTDLANIQGGCERIKNTPLPPVYTTLGHRVVLSYCFLLPFGLVSDLEVLTPLVTTVIGFAFLILSRISLLLENPFGLRPNDLPLTAMARTIEIDVLQSLEADEEEVPPPVRAVDGVLL